MSIRIHQLSKKIGLGNKELIALLQERGYQVTSASSTIDNISAESLVEEFEKKAAEAEAAAKAEAERAEAEKVAAEKAEAEKAAAEAEAEAEAEAKPADTAPGQPGGGLPPGVFVKSAEQVKQERIEREEARRAKVTPPQPPRPAPVRAPAPPVPPPVSVKPAQPSPPPPARPPASVPAAQPSSMVPPRPGNAAPPPPASPTNLAPPPRPARPGSESAEPPAAPAEAGEGEASSEDVKVIQIKPPIVVRDFANMLGMKPFKLISEMMEMGIFAALNQSIDEEVASQLAVKHGFLLDVKHRGDSQAPKEEEKEEKKVDESQFLEPRPPVVCIMGHVDHGKTSLLDKIRSANVVAGEAGGITQHIGAYQVTVNGRKITFIDTPGHAAFNEMRARGANVTDIAILVVAADDGFMPQTDEALQYIRQAGVTPIVAINKIDTRGANIDRVKTQMQERNLAPEDWGGEIVTVPVSATRGDGIDELLEMILLQADVLELKANPKGEVKGVVIEAEIEVGRGPTATVLVESGTLKTGSTVVCGPYYAKVRAMFDDQGKPVKEAPPSSAVRVIGWSGTPECGGIVTTVKNEREAKRVTEQVAFEMKRAAAASTAPAAKPVSIEQMFEAIAAQQQKVLRVVIKADVFGSAEAVVSGLKAIKSNKVKLEIIACEVGPISKNDVLMASAANAIVVGFGVKKETGVDALAKHHSVEIVTFDIIYELIDSIRDKMADLLEPEIRETKIGVAEVRAVFPVAKGFVAGCLVVEGRVQTNVSARVRRGNNIEFEGKIISVRRVKDEVKEVRAGTECGIQIEGYNEFQPGDFIECFEIEKIRASL